MSETMTMDLNGESLKDGPGAQLALIRSHRGYRADYVAEKLNLRVQLIELLEADHYSKMPEPVFIKGYLRAYAKLLDVDPESYIALFNQQYVHEGKSEPLLWQSARQTHKAEHTLRWITASFAVAVLMAVIIWWHNTNENEVVFPAPNQPAKASVSSSEAKVISTDSSTMLSQLMVPLDSSSE